MSEDDRWSDVIHQVLDALHDANVDDPNTRDALAEGVRQALESLDADMDLDIEIVGRDSADTPKPAMDVEVVDGGRSADSPPTEGKKPTLRIAEPSDDPSTVTATDGQPYVTQVKVLQGSPVMPIRNPASQGHGWISIPNNGTADGAWQTIYLGLRPRLYRLACLPGGRLDVAVDGTQIERLSPGQSIDVEGLAIRVTSPDADGAMGTYIPVPAGWGEE